MAIEINMGNLHVLDNGVVIVPRNEKITFSLEGLTITFLIKDSIGSEEEKNSFDIIPDVSSGSMLINLRVLPDADFASPIDPIVVAQSGNSNLCFKFSVKAINKYDKILFYTWYIEKGGDNE